MSTQVRLSIRYKILFIVTFLLVSSTFVQAIIAARIFERDKTELVFDLNKNIVTSMSAELQATLRSAIDKLKLFSLFYEAGKNQESLVDLLESDENLTYVGIFSQQKLKRDFKQRQFSDTYSISDSFYQQILEKKPAPFSQIKKEGYFVWNATLEGSPTLVGIGIYIPSQESSQDLISIAYMSADKFLKKMRAETLTQVFVIDSLGKVLIHSDAGYSARGTDFSHLPVAKEFLKHSSNLGVIQSDVDGGNELSAYARVNLGNLGVISRADGRLAFVAVKQVLAQNGTLSLMIVTLTFIVTVLLSRSLTGPLRTLTQAMAKVAKGEYQEVIPSTKDEIGVLSHAFNQMSRDVKQSKEALEEINANLEQKVKERTQLLEEMAIRDALTGTYNRRFFNERLKNEVDRSKRFKHPLSITYMDIDHFKVYNDTNGHPAGDALLIEFAKLLKGSLRQTDMLARIGGEEFCVIMPETPLEGALAKAESLRKEICNYAFKHREKQPLKVVSASIGVSTLGNGLETDEDLIKAADDALYQSKHGGRNRVSTIEQKKAS